MKIPFRIFANFTFVLLFPTLGFIVAAHAQGIEKIAGDKCDKIIADKWPGRHGDQMLKELYIVTSDAVYYFDEMRKAGDPCEKILGADPQTFAVSEPDLSFTAWDWAKDKSAIYYDDNILRGADVASFQVLDRIWAKDKNHVYFENVISFTSEPIKDVDAPSFAIFGYGNFAHDKNHVYEADLLNYDGDPSTQKLLEVIPTIDPASFEVVHQEPDTAEDLYVKDKSAVFYYAGQNDEDGLSKIDGADPATFQILGQCFHGFEMEASYAKDKNHVYCGSDIVMGADVASFVYLGTLEYGPPRGGYGVAKDKNCLWSQGKKVLDKKGACINPTTCSKRIIDKFNNEDDSKEVCGISA